MNKQINRALLVGVWALASAMGCAPDWRPPPSETAGYQVEIQPASEPDAVPPVAQLLVSAPAENELQLFRGRLGKTSLAQLEDGVPSAALQARLVPLSVFPAEGEQLLVPRQLLELGADYTLASGAPLWSFELRVIAEDPLSQLQLVWPPAGLSRGAMHGVWCLPASMNSGAFSAVGPAAEALRELLPSAVEVELLPARLSAMLMPGVGAAGAGCVRLPASPWPDAAPEVMLPPLLHGADGAPLARFEPLPLVRHADDSTPVNPGCNADEQPFGPGCVRVADDRAWVRSVDRRLWSISDDTGRAVMAIADADTPFTLHPLAPDSQLSLQLFTIGLDGSVSEHTTQLATAPARPHLVVSEVLANPLGPEPHQEWVEIYNDGSAAAQLDEYHLQDVGGDAWLPAVSLAPGEYAILVKDTFDETADYDVVIPADALLLRLPALGKNGLSNAGEALKLLHHDQVVSRFPAAPKPEAGLSVARVDMRADVDDERAFMVARPTPGS